MCGSGIAEQGDHKTLLAQRGLYFDLWNKQIRAEEQGSEEVSAPALPAGGKIDESAPGSGEASAAPSVKGLPAGGGHGHP